MSAIQQLNDELATLVETAGRSLVEVKDGRHGGAAGTVWHSAGLILTNAHVVNHKRPRVVLPDGRTLDARILAHDTSHDLAALSVDAESLYPIALGKSSALKPGQFVVALGHPWGVKGVATAGIVMGSGPEYLKISYSQGLVAVNQPLGVGYFQVLRP